MAHTGIFAGLATAALLLAGGTASAQTQTASHGALYEKVLSSLQCKEDQVCQPTSSSRKRGFKASGEAAHQYDLKTENGRRALETAAKRGVTPTLDVEVYFPYNSHELTDETRRKLDDVGAAFRERSLAGWRFAIIGHTDAVGSTNFNQELSERRAAAVQDYLVRSASIDTNRLSAWGRGKSELKAPEDPTSGVNRRVQLINSGSAELAAQPSGGGTPAATPQPAPASDPPPAASVRPPGTVETSRPGNDEGECRRYSPIANKVVSCDQ